MAYRALTEFAFRSRILDITHINVKIETVSSEVFTYRVRVDNKSVNALQFKVRCLCTFRFMKCIKKHKVLCQLRN